MKTPADEVVEDARNNERDEVEHYEIGKENGQILIARPLECTFHDFWKAAVLERSGGGEAEEPRRAVDTSEPPDTEVDALGPAQSAYLVCLHGVADGDVAFHGEGY